MIPNMDAWFAMAAVIAVALIVGIVLLAMLLSAKRQLVKARRQAERDHAALLESLSADETIRNAEALAILQEKAGPAIFAIRAELGGLSRLTRASDAETEEARARLTAISENVVQVQRVNAQIIELLRARGQ